MKIAVVIPCHDEESTIGAVVGGFREAGERLGMEVELVVCDNASTDRTAASALEAGAVVLREPRLGKGEAIRRLFSEVEADLYVMVDGDGTYSPADLPRLVRALLEERLDMVVGRRAQGVGQNAYRPGHMFGNRMLSGLVRWFFGATIRDVLSGYRVMSRRFVKTFPAETRGFEIETELTVAAFDARCPVGEVTIGYRERPVGSSSKLRTWRDGFRILIWILLLVRDVRPLLFFGVCSAALAGVSAIALVPVVRAYLATGEVLRFPTLIAAVGTLTCAALSLVSGLVLDQVAALRRQQRRLAYLATPPRLPGCPRTGNDLDRPAAP